MKKINIYSTKNINIISLIITIIIILILNLFINNLQKINSTEVNNEKLISENQKNKIKENKNIQNKNDEGNMNWYIEITSIKLKAPIEDTTDMKVLNKAVGHFEETPFTDGNIGLAGHNRGYEKNYFQNLKSIKKGAELKYKYYDFERIYIVEKIEIIKDTDWSNLENTKENKITLITCVENKPNMRLCVQGVEKLN